MFFLGQPQISKKNGYMFDKWWLSNGYWWWWLSYGVVHAIRMSLYQTNAKRDEIQHHTAKQGDNHAKEQMLVFSFGERCRALPHNDTPSAPFLRLQYPRKWQDHRSNIFSLPETKKVNKQQSPIINNKTLNRSKPIGNSKQTLNQP